MAENDRGRPEPPPMPGKKAGGKADEWNYELLGTLAMIGGVGGVLISGLQFFGSVQDNDPVSAVWFAAGVGCGIVVLLAAILQVLTRRL